MCFVQLFINYGKFYRNQYSLPAVSRLARRGEQWLHVCNIQLFRERLSEKVHATIPKGIVGSFEFTFLQRSLKEWYERPWMFVCES